VLGATRRGFAQRRELARARHRRLLARAAPGRRTTHATAARRAARRYALGNAREGRHMTHKLFELTRDSFEPLLQARFALRLEGGLLELELVELKSLGASRGTHREPFSLIFRGPREHWFAQGTYPVQHPKLGTLPLFLVPVGPDAAGMMQYQAIFT
jgi:hypothetical protein